MKAAVFANVIEAMVDAVFVLDESGNISITNRAAQTLTGYSASELDTVSIGKVIVDDNAYVGTKGDGKYFKRGLSQYLI